MKEVVSMDHLPKI